MKSKKLSKKLSLSKITIASLNGNEMNGVAGGITEVACDTWRTDCTCVTCTCVACPSVHTGCYPNCTQPQCPV
jgi:hypothetical protein